MVTTTDPVQIKSAAAMSPTAASATTLNAPIEIRLIGGPTALLEIGGLRILTDPTFDPPGDHPIGSRKLVKTTPPAASAEEIGAIDVVLLSHDQHPDNLDNAGRQLLANVPLVLTTEDGASRLGGTSRHLPAWGHYEVALPDGGSLTVYGVPAQHGPDNTEHLTGQVRGFVLTAEGGPTVYVSGDNASLRVVQEIADHVGRIDIAVLFAGAGRSSLMDAFLTLSGEQTARAAQILNASAVVPVHAEGWGHFTEGTDEIVAAFERHQESERLVVLGRGESMTFALNTAGELHRSSASPDRAAPEPEA